MKLFFRGTVSLFLFFYELASKDTIIICLYNKSITSKKNTVNSIFYLQPDAQADGTTLYELTTDEEGKNSAQIYVSVTAIVEETKEE